MVKPKQQEQAAAPQSFESLAPKLSSGVLKYVTDQGFTRMTPVQAATIPLFLAHKDVAVQAVTGSGKTLSFLIPVVEHLLKHPLRKTQIGALVLSPTRELAQQTYAVAKALCMATDLAEPLLLVGGSAGSSGSSGSTNHRPVTADLQTFKEAGCDIVIGTPGRVEDVLTRYMVVDCSELEYLILDEADVLLNMGFANSLQNILGKLPKMRRTGLFSATTSTSSTTTNSLQEWMKRAGLRNPVWIDVAIASKDKTTADKTSESKTPIQSKSQATPSSLTNYYIVTTLDEKLSRLASFLQSHPNDKMIVFFLTCACVEFYGTALQKVLPDQYIELLHGKMVQKRREKSMERYRACNETNEASALGGALFCTDVAARGLDVTDVHWVVQFDPPQDPSFYVHRVGRSARAGKTGASLLFLTRKEEPYVDFLRMRKIPLIPLPATEVCTPPDEEVDAEEKPKKSKNAKDSDEGPTARRILSASDPSITIEDILPKVQGLVLNDRDMLEKGTKAFTSFIRAYKEHHCSFIFRFASLDLGVLATSFCLLRLPKMPELREILLRHRGKLPNFETCTSQVDIFAIPYKDKNREQARQKRLEQEVAAGGKNAKLIKAEQRKAEMERKQKERRKAAVEKGRNPDKKRGKHQQIVDEWDDLAKEERLYKKMRRGKISKEEYDDLMYGNAK